MGLKSGSRDAGLDESEEEEASEEEVTELHAEDADESGSEPGELPVSEESVSAAEEVESDEEPETTSDRPSMDSIPYKLRRDKVNEGRDQVPYFLREEVVEAESDLQATLEEILGEDVYKSDYREASMVVAQRNPELVAEVLREWGYDLDAV